MSEESPDTGSTESTAEKTGLVAGFKGMPGAEKILAAGAAAFLLGFTFDTRWNTLFAFGKKYADPWKHTLGFVGSVVVLALIITKLLGIKVVDKKLYPKLVVFAALIPALGLLIDELRNFWGFLILGSIVLMAYAGAKITSRDEMLK